MSGEAVVVTVPIAAVAVAGPVLLAGAAIAGTAAVGLLAAKGIAAGIGAIIDHQVEAARRRAEEERARLAEWEAFQRRQQQAMEEARRRHEAIKQMQERLSEVRLQEPAQRSKPDALSVPTARGYVSEASLQASAREAMSKVLGEISAALEALPESLRAHPASPIPSLQQQVVRFVKQLEGKRLPDQYQIEALKTTAERSVANFMSRIEAEHSERDKRLTRVDTALNLLLVLEQLPSGPGGKLSTIRSQLIKAFTRGEITAGELDGIEKSLNALAEKAAKRVATGALRPALAEALLRHLQTLGYKVLTGFPAELNEATANACVQVPGGDQVAIYLDSDARLRFQFEHERKTADDVPMSADEIAFARAQETRWWKDLRTAVALLVEEGFDSTLTYDRKCPAIPVAVWVPFAKGQTTQVEAPEIDAEEEERQRRRVIAERQPKHRSRS